MDFSYRIDSVLLILLRVPLLTTKPAPSLTAIGQSLPKGMPSAWIGKGLSDSVWIVPCTTAEASYGGTRSPKPSLRLRLAVKASAKQGEKAWYNQPDACRSKGPCRRCHRPHRDGFATWLCNIPTGMDLRDSLGDSYGKASHWERGGLATGRQVPRGSAPKSRIQSSTLGFNTCYLEL